MENIDLKEMERKVYLSYTEDGLYDIIAGVVILSIGLGEMTLNSIFTVFMIIAICLIASVKKQITSPRIGYVKFSRERNRTAWTWRIGFTVLLVACVFLTTIMWLVPGEGSGSLYEWFWANFMFAGGILAALAALIAGIITGIKRLYVYAILTWLIYGICFALKVPSWIYIMAMGAIILIWGISILVLFILKYPLIPQDAFTEGGNDVCT